jgi:3-hydroxybenzoate 6-monooxygenase
VKSFGLGAALIAGGGIGGLSLAAALARLGRNAILLERGSFQDETGAGIQLGANAVKRLRTLGAFEAIEPLAVRPEALWIFDAIMGRRLSAPKLGRSFEARHGAPYLCLRRADLHGALYALCQCFASLELMPHAAIAEISDDGSMVAAKTLAGQEFASSFLVGADGLWSGVRAFVAPRSRLAFAHQTASRALIPTEGLPAPFDASVVTLWLGPHAHLVTYPVHGGKALNLVLARQGGSAASGWGESAGAGAIPAATAAWADAPRALLERVQSWRSWSLYRLAGMTRWYSGNVVLLGDAAHPILPFLAQGAALAIEDATTLAEALARCGGHGAAFEHYLRRRLGRVERVASQSSRLGRLYHLRGALRWGRNLVLAQQSPDRAMRRFDWLYDG